MQTDNLYIEVQPEMIAAVKKELAEGNDFYALYAKYKNLSIQEEYEGGDIEKITKYQFACDLAKHMITENAMEQQGYKKDDKGMWHQP